MPNLAREILRFAQDDNADFSDTARGKDKKLNIYISLMHFLRP
jgi:hypothetical protein